MTPLVGLLTRVYQLGGLGPRAAALAEAALAEDVGSGTTCVDGGARVLVRASAPGGDVRVGVRVADGRWRFVGAEGATEVRLAGGEEGAWSAERSAKGAVDWALAPRHDPVGHAVGALGRAGWEVLAPSFAELLRVPEARFRWAGRWAVGRGPDGVRVGTSGWARLADDADKARALASVALRLGGDDTVAALHDLVTREATVRRVGRAVYLGDGGLGVVWVVG